MRLRRVAAGLAALVCGGSLAGCGVIAAVQSEVDPVAQARTINLAAVRTGQLLGFQITGTETLNDGDTVTTSRFSGAMNVPQGIESVQQSIRIGPRTYSIHDMYRGPMIYSDLSRLPGFPARMRRWVSFNITQAYGTPVPSTGDPAQFVDFLRYPGLSARSMGAAAAGGVSATLYRVTMNLDAYLHALPRRLHQLAAENVDVVERATGRHTLDEDVWVDASGLIRQISWGTTECVAGQPLTSSILLELSRFGPVRRFRLPAPHQSTSITAGLRASLRAIRQLPLGCQPDA